MSELINVRQVIENTRRAIDAAFADPDEWGWLAARKQAYLQMLEAMADARRELGDFEAARLCDDTSNRLEYWLPPDEGDWADLGLTLTPLPPAIA